jgi:metal-responsive CopG/Arc/MetJ family transcriptional regulator
VTRRAHVVLPVDLLADIDKIAGRHGRSAFLAEVAQKEIKLRRQREALVEAAGAWKVKDHPELAKGAEAWVRKLRSLDQKRFEDLERRRNQR